MSFHSRLRAITPAWLQYRIDLKRCIDEAEKHAKAMPPNNRESHESGAMYDHACTHFELREWNRSLVTSNYRRIAAKLSVPMPDINDPRMYEAVEMEKTEHSTKYLTSYGESVIRAAIREERKHRRESVGYWFGIAVGLIGALTGLVSAFK